MVLVPSVLLLASFPSEESLRKSVEEAKRAAPLSFLFSHQDISQDGLVEGEAITEEEIFEWNLWNYSYQYLQLVGFQITRSISLIDGSDWNPTSAMSVLEAAILVDPSRLESIKDAIGHYFEGKLRTAIPLLALEMEPIVRGVVHKLGLVTVTQSDNRNPKLQRVKYLNECLNVPEIQKLLGGRWIWAMNALLTHDGGPKLRHCVAHGRPIEHLLNQQAADVLVCLLLWIANFKEGPPTSTATEHKV